MYTQINITILYFYLYIYYRSYQQTNKLG